MGDTPWVKFFSSDWLGGTSGLTAAERGVYITLCALIYEFDGPIVRDDKRLARRCGCPKASFIRILSALIDEGKLVQNGEHLTNAKCEKEITDRKKRSEKARAVAHQRWNAPDGKTQQKQGVVDASAMLAQCEPEPEPEEVKREAKASPKKPESRGTRLPDDWALDRGLYEWSISEGLSDAEIRNETDKFKDYWSGVAGAKARKANWPATWRNWARKFIADRKPATRGNRKDDELNRILRDQQQRDSQERPVHSPEGVKGMDSGPDGDAVGPLFPTGHGVDSIPADCERLGRDFVGHSPAGDRAGHQGALADAGQGAADPWGDPGDGAQVSCLPLAVGRR